MWGSQNGKYLVKWWKVWKGGGSFQSDSTGLYWIIMASVGVGWWKVCFSFVIRFSSWLLGSSKLLSLVFMCTVASRCSQVGKFCSKVV